ncbi:hypothetical protein GGR51DRAFT_573018 [Nemania sp. FL0031]|nr:hypothetical protein GGR51DRAFT_573018 [Nemania sp. FL0031]
MPPPSSNQRFVRRRHPTRQELLTREILHRFGPIEHENRLLTTLWETWDIPRLERIIQRTTNLQQYTATSLEELDDPTQDHSNIWNVMHQLSLFLAQARDFLDRRLAEERQRETAQGEAVEEEAVEEEAVEEEAVEEEAVEEEAVEEEATQGEEA